MNDTVSDALPLDADLQQAIAHHQAGRFEEAEDLYMAILQAQPYHAIANHNMGLLAGQVGQHVAGLPYLRQALSVNPDEGQFWLSYAAGLIKASQPEQALEILDGALKRGLDNADSQALRDQAAAAVASAAHAPSQQEIDAIVGLYQAGDYAQLESATRALIAQFPDAPFGWSVLGTALQLQGKNALQVLQKTVELAPQDAEAHGNLGNAWQAAGQHGLAIASYRRALELNPDFAEVHCNLGSALQAEQRLGQAAASYRRALELNPAYALAHFNLGNTLKEQGELEAAAASYRSALALVPDDAEVHANLGNTLQALEQFDAAAASYRRALELNPRYTLAHCNLGAALQALEQPEQAMECYLRALEVEPDSAEAQRGIGHALHALKRSDEAAQAYQRALALEPDHAPTHSNLGRALFAADKIDAAAASYRRALELEPDSANAHSHLALVLQANDELEQALALHQRAAELDPASVPLRTYLGHALKQLRRFDEAVLAYRTAVELRPDDADLYNDLGIGLQDAGEMAQAILMYRKAIELRPEFDLAHSNQGVALEALRDFDAARLCYQRAIDIEPKSSRNHFNMGNCLRSMQQFDGALACYRRSLELQPDYVGSHTNLCATLSEMGLMEQAVSSCQAALDIDPGYELAHSNLLFCLSHVRGIDAGALFAEHLRFGEQFEAPLRAAWPQHENGRDPERRLEIGFVSGDFCDHAVAHFITPLLERLSQSKRLSLHAYYNHDQIDNVTLRLRELMPDWHQVAHLSDVQLSRQIQADRIDVLIDLSGHTARNRLLTFARKPAPLQASWIGYPGSTGLQAMDYFLTDRFLLPPEQFESQYTEKFAFLPASVPFLPSAQAPEVSPLPALAKGHITFGSFNRPNKLSREVIALWSRLLRAVPTAHMWMGAMAADGQYGYLIEWFEAEGIPLSRLSFHRRSDMRGYLRMHEQVDICLDTFPYTGGTTTLHGLWMGVPMLTLAGATTASRTSAAILAHLQLDAFVGRDADDFVQKGVFIANDLALLTTLRASLRHLMEVSALGQPAPIAAGLEGAFRAMWQRWCAGLAPATFEVEIDPDAQAAPQRPDGEVQA